MRGVTVFLKLSEPLMFTYKINKVNLLLHETFRRLKCFKMHCFGQFYCSSSGNAAPATFQSPPYSAGTTVPEKKKKKKKKQKKITLLIYVKEKKQCYFSLAGFF